MARLVVIRNLFLILVLVLLIGSCIMPLRETPTDSESPALAPAEVPTQEPEPKFLSSLQLTMPADLITAIGLALDIIGILFLFWFAPEKIPDPQSTVGFAIEPPEIRENWRKNQRLRRWIVRLSVVVIVVGFIFQAIAVLFF